MSVFEQVESTPTVVQCVAEVRLGMPAHAVGPTIRFYTEWLGLRPWADPRIVPGCYGLGHYRRGLLLEMRHDPEVDEVRRRMTLVVASLETIERRLAEAQWPFEHIQGIGPSDDRLVLQDPAGHRIEVRQSRPL